MHMLRPALTFPSAVAILAAAIFMMPVACSGDDNGADPTDRPATTDASGTPSGGVALRDIDLATDDSAIGISGVDAEDLLTGTTSVAMGDFNDDGESDLLVGAPQGDGRDDDRPDAGEAYVLFGPIEQSIDLAATRADVVIYGSSAGDGLGYSVLAADINDDGRDDVLVGAPGVTAGFDLRTDQGRVYVFYGGSDLKDAAILDLQEDVFDLAVTGAEGFSRLGHAMAAGDVNGDGKGDLVVGAPFAGRAADSSPGSERTALGEAYVILGGEGLTGELNIARDEYDSLISGAYAFGEFGSSIAIGDLDDDGKDDIVVGAHRSSAGDPARGSSGATYVFYGSTELDRSISAQDKDEDVVLVGAAGATLGYPVITGDFNGDGTADIAIGAQLEPTGDVQGSGAIHVFYGGDRLAETIDLAEDRADVRIGGRETSEFLPSALASADLDDDGRDELVAGSMLIAASDDRFGSGVVYVVSLEESTGDTINLSTDTAAIVLGAAAGDRLGNALGAGQVADGTAGIVALAPLADGNNRLDSGIVYLLGLQR